MDTYSVITTKFIKGSIIHHSDRNHFYKLLYRTLVKNEQPIGKSWIEGWAYQQCNSNGEIISEEVFTRPTSLFDGDWTFIK